MGELEDKIKQLLSSDQGIDQISSIAASILGKKPGGKEVIPSHEAFGAANSPPSEASAQEDAFERLQRAMKKDGFPEGTAGAPVGDFASLFNVSSLTKALGSVDMQNVVDLKKINLLNAIKPFLDPPRASQIDRAIRMVRLTMVAEQVIHSHPRGANDV